MRYSRQALLIFGASALLGLVVVSANLPGLARIASLGMAAGIVLLPVALLADWRQRIPRPKTKAKSPKRGASSARRRPRQRR